MTQVSADDRTERETHQTSKAVSASITNHARPPTKVTSAAKSIAYVHPSFVTITAVSTGDSQPPRLRCTPQSVAAHSLYENSDPYRLVESSGVLDLSAAEYAALDDRRVRVCGSKFDAAQTYTIKLEGAERVGYQSVVIGSIRDPYIIRQIESWISRLKQKVRERAAEVFSGDRVLGEHLFNVRVYGKDGTMGPLEPVKKITSHEICLVMEVTAATQEIATTIVSLARHIALHLPIPEWNGFITGMACIYSPAYLERGPVYRFSVNHVVEPDDPYEMFPIEYTNVG